MQELRRRCQPCNQVQVVQDRVHHLDTALQKREFGRHSQWSRISQRNRLRLSLLAREATGKLRNSAISRGRKRRNE